jgi:hypothetical protein
MLNAKSITAAKAGESVSRNVTIVRHKLFAKQDAKRSKRCSRR